MPLNSGTLSKGGTHAHQRSSPEIGNRRGGPSCEADALVSINRGTCAAVRREIEHFAPMALARSESLAVAIPATPNGMPVRERR
jgi:hypothetical protein